MTTEILENKNEVLLINTSKQNIPEKYYVYLPNNLCIDSLVENNPPNIKNFHKDKLKYIISLLYSIPVRLKDYDFELNNGFIPMNSEVLKRRVREYNNYLDYLCNQGILEKRQNIKYLAGKYSSAYRFKTEYNTEPTRKSITWKRLIKAICKNVTKEEFLFVDSTERNLEYLEKWWNDNIQFDYQGAKKWLKKLYFKEKLEGKKFCKRKYYIRLLVVKKFKSRDYILHQDSTSGRSHNLLTQLKSELRQFIKYKDKSLVAVDITNSQPFLSLALLNKKSFEGNYITDKIELYNPNSKIKSSIMQALSDDSFVNKEDIQKYYQLVKEGLFYEMFGELLVEKKLIEKSSPEEIRKKAKKIMFASLFGHNNEKCEIKDKKTGKSHYIPNEGMILFKQTFPTVFEIFRTIKVGKHNALACILQNLEAELVLHRACKIISEENPQIPIYTLHDSIITTEENAKYVKRVLSQVLMEAIGIAPQIKEEKWQLETKKVA
jgi:hypothetical protein